MKRLPQIHPFLRDETGGILVFFAMAMVVFLGLMALIFDTGRMATTQSELQSFSDSVSLAAAAELDGGADALTRARAAASALIFDTQTFAQGSTDLSGDEGVTLTFYRPDEMGGFTRAAEYETTSPFRARYVESVVAERAVETGLSAAFAALSQSSAAKNTVSAASVAGLSFEACNVAPVAVCLPTVEFDAKAAVGTSLELKASVNVNSLLPGNIAVVDTLTDALDGLQVCAGLIGGALDACLLAARKPETACTGQGGLTISTDVNASGLLQSLDTRLGLFSGLASGLAGSSDFAAAPNVLSGLTTAAGLCVPNLAATGAANLGLPKDDCLTAGSCLMQGNGNWSAGRAAYVSAHFGGADPAPSATTRFEFYKAEVAASAKAGGLVGNVVGVVDGVVGGVVGGLLGSGSTFKPKLCAPPTAADVNRRLMVVAGIDCSGGGINGAQAKPAVQTYLEVFVLGPSENGLLNVEVSACLGGSCGGGHLETDIRDVVRLVE